MNRFFKTLLALAAFGASSTAFGEDWPRFLGPNGNGILENDDSLRLDWKSKQPQTTWTRQVGAGCAAFSIADGKALTLGNRKNQDTIWCFDASSGDLIWKHSYDEPLHAKYYTGGASVTPTIDGDRVYSVSKSGKLFCLDLDTGEVLWQKDYQRDFDGRKGDWGWAASPVIHGELLLIDPGAKAGALVALDKKTGKVQWKTGDRQPGYATPVFFQHEGNDAVALFHKKALVGYQLEAPRDTIFTFPWRTNYGVNASNSHYRDGKLFLSSGYGQGYAVIDITREPPEIVHRERQLQLKMQTSLLIGDRVIAHYGGDGKANDLISMNFDTGKINWRTDVPGDLGNVIAVGEHLIVFTDSGHVILGKDSGNKFQELGRKHALLGTSWAPPAYSNGYLFLRNNQGKAICLDASAN